MRKQNFIPPIPISPRESCKYSWFGSSESWSMVQPLISLSWSPDLVVVCFKQSLGKAFSNCFLSQVNCWIITELQRSGQNFRDLAQNCTRNGVVLQCNFWSAILSAWVSAIKLTHLSSFKTSNVICSAKCDGELIRQGHFSRSHQQSAVSAQSHTERSLEIHPRGFSQEQKAAFCSVLNKQQQSVLASIRY